MPTINMYQGRDGYYILARPSDETGTITYKIRSYGNPVVSEIGFKNGEQITWGSIDALKSLGIIYTDGSGTVTPDNFDPDSDLLQNHSISEHKARRMLSAAQKHLEMSQQHLKHVADALDISYSQSGNKSQSSMLTGTREDSSRQQYTTSSAEGNYPLVDSSMTYEELESGKKYTGIIDRISNSGNGIIELNNGLVNIGECYRPDVGSRVVFVFSDDQICDVVSGINESNATTGKDSHDLGEYLTSKEQQLLEKL